MKINSQIAMGQLCLGEGTFGNVYRGILMFRGVDCEVAIKLFKQEKGNSYEAICKDAEVEASAILEISDRLMNRD